MGAWSGALSWRDLLGLRARIAWSAALAALGLAVALGSGAALSRGHLAQQGSEHELGQLQQAIAAVELEQRSYAQQLERYGQIARLGIVGPEHRLEWAAQLKRSGDARGIVELDYEFAAQRRLSDAQESPVALLASRMILRLRVLHEGDLLDFLADLRSQEAFHPRLVACRLERLPLPERAAKAAPRLEAECSLDWLTLRTAEASP